MSNLSIALERMEFALEHRPGRLPRILVLDILALRIRRERNQLANLSDAQLTDIGVDREAALRESTRRFDDIPAHRVER